MLENAASSRVVETGNGPVQGISRDKVMAFYGVPYAAAPVGELRFAAPQPAAHWDKPLNCTTPAPSPPQGPSRLDAVMGIAPFEQSEDCLTLSIWTPAADTKRRPVLIWLHGGAYQSGGGSQIFYDGANMAAAGDMVVVSVNYRLGALGYLYLPGMESAGGAPANRGLLDQMAALEWVVQNIAAFGGDPGNVTLAGQSAGGGSVLALLANPQSRKHIHRAILQSAPAFTLEHVQAEEFSQRFHQLAGVAPGDLSALRQLPVADIIAAQRALAMQVAAAGGRTIPFQIIADLAPCAGNPAEQLALNGAHAIPLLIGSTLDEGHAWLAQDEALTANEDFAMVDNIATAAGFLTNAGDLPEARRSTAKKPWELLSAMLTWSVFEKAAHRFASDHARQGGKAYVYRFEWRPTPDARFGACHCIEIPFVFDNLDGWPDAEMVRGRSQSSYERLARTTQDAWIAFARNGAPATASLPAWPAWNASQRQVMVLDNQPHVEQSPV